MTRLSNSTLETLERAALLAAQSTFLAWLARQAEWAAACHADRVKVNALGKAVRELQKALRPFAGGQPSANRLHLVSGLARAAPLGGAIGCEARLGELDKFLGYMGIALGAQPARGRIADPRVHAWVFIAADQWVTTFSKRPAANKAGRGRFCAALLSLDDDRQARDASLPRVAVGAIAAALGRWKALKKSPG